ncbi:unnamed protein product [Clonostachys chloroleuca]|uniref:Zn(2)-C6 fungal-type domain-containing protein n=1 Tax=Clonostachys chloroleuca TaxID=1926264 RepID=A0AA35MBF4_9HYPO|nr:unnamed protein product [Clonostachys chloroleuca]
MSLPSSLPSAFGSEISFTTLLGAEGTEAEESMTTPVPSHRKPDRLSVACKQCRKRKVRCDAQQPKCKNCRVRNEVCETSDLRRPGKGPAVRRRAARSTGSRSQYDQQDPASPVVPSPRSNKSGPHSEDLSSFQNTGTNHSQGDIESPTELASSNVTAQSFHDIPSFSATSKQSRPSRPAKNHISWLTRGYQASAAAQVQETGSEQAEQDSSSEVTPDVVVNTDGTPYRVKFQGGSSIQSLFTFVDLHLAIHGFDPASPLFRHGMHESEEIPLSLALKLPPLPDHQKINRCLDVFFDRLWPFYPVITRSTFEAEIDTIISQQPQEVSDLQFSIQHTHIPCLVAVYCVLCIGINELSTADSELSIEYLNAGYQLYSHLVATPYLPSAQSLFLLALALRSWGKDGQAWHIVGQAIRISQSLGLHKLVMRHSPVKAQGTPYKHSDTLGERLWWSCYALEKQMQLECGRPSIIDTEFDNITLTWSQDLTTGDSSPYFKAWISLAGIMGRISDRIYAHKFGSAEEMLSETIKLDKHLLEWETSLPDSLRPRDIFLEHLDEASKICAGFLSQQYYHAQISALRVSLIFPQHAFLAEIKRHGTKLSQTQRLLAGASICAQAARAVATQILQLADENVRSPSLGISQTFLASVVLALVILRQPNSRLARSDVELLTSATEHMEAWYYHCGFSPGFIQVFVEMRNRVGSVFLKTSAKAPQRSSSIATSLPRTQDAVSQGSGFTPSMAGSYGHAGTTPTHGSSAMSGMGNQNTVNGFDDSALNFFGNMDFEELWNMMDSDFMSYDTDIQVIPS